MEVPRTYINGILKIKPIFFWRRSRYALLLFILQFFSLLIQAVEVERFEHLNSSEGLSQNSVLSIFCDHKGYIWLGTMDGLNRYDGYSFKVFKSGAGKENCLTNNRISKIWEDERHFIWVNTYDGYTHWYNPASDKFKTIPFYYLSEEEKNSNFTCFFQESKDEIWIGTSNSGLYYLSYDSIINDYQVKKFLSRGVVSISNNKINFIQRDLQNNLWIGTQQGLNKLDPLSRKSEQEKFEHFHIDRNFTVASSNDSVLFLGTSEHGLEIFDIPGNQFLPLPSSLNNLSGEEITLLQIININYLAIGTGTQGLFLYNMQGGKLNEITSHGKRIERIYVDSFGKLWINTENFGVTLYDPEIKTSTYFQLTQDEIRALVDEERQYFYEDATNQLWIGLHGAGLAFYNREEKKFQFYRNNPDDPHSISSNYVHCLTQDKSGILWMGTGQINGGINKLIPANPSFHHISPMKVVNDMVDNLIRCVYEDDQGNIWAASKSGIIYIYDSSFNLIKTLLDIPLEHGNLPGNNIYSILQDSKGYIWLGSKGGGLAVSTTSLGKTNLAHQNLKFRVYKNDPLDKHSLSSNNIYSIIEDKLGQVWIGTYGGGLNRIESRTKDKLVCKHFTPANSNLSVNEIRNICEDSQGRIWIATVFGINLLQNQDLSSDSLEFLVFNNEYMSDSSISYNDIVHIYEDSQSQIWFSTYGGGVNSLVNLSPDKATFSHITSENGLVNDAVFGILEDDFGHLWFSTETGISHYNPEDGSIENYDEKNGLKSDRFSENTCIKLSSGKLLFGCMDGMLVVDPKNMQRNSYEPPVVLTNFQLFNKDVDIHSEDAPFDSQIEYLDEIILKHNQSSFSIEYSALSYFDPQKNVYQFKLLGFEENWNDVGNLTRATYTNLSHGKYEFQVKAASWDGTWNPEPRRIRITILPPWYKTLFAYLIYVIVLILLVEISRRILIKYNHMRRDLLVERRVNDIKLQFFTNISHEIRTPLTLILGPLEDIKTHKTLPKSLRHSIEIMDANGKRMLRLVNQLLDFRKIQKNKMRLKIQEVEIIQFVTEVFENFKPLAHKKKIDFTLSSEIESLGVWIDPEKLDSVLFNVLSNAFKFTAQNKKIALHIRKAANSDLEIICSDEGKGISSDKIPILFQRYTPLSGSDINYQGTGIGLALSYEIMKLHKGEIRVESKENRGSSFTIMIKAGKDHYSEEELLKTKNNQVLSHQHMDEEVDEKTVSTEKEEIKKEEPEHTILLVEDNDEIVDYVRHILHPNYRLSVAADGEQGLAKLGSVHPDLILTDVMMPVMDGIEMTKKIKSSFEISHIPIIMLTAKSQIEDQIHGIEAGAEAYILKPFNANYLLAVISTMLKQREILLSRMLNRNESLSEGINITSKDEKFIENVMKIIEENYSNSEFNVEQLVEKSSVSRTVFYNKIKGLTGCAPVEFLRNSRLKIASKMLIESGYNVSEVGYMTGFSDIKYFSKCFKTLFGLSPSEYKSRNSEA